MAQEKQCDYELVDAMQDKLVHITLVLYNRLYNNMIVLDKYGSKTTKFHQLLHADLYTRNSYNW